MQVTALSFVPPKGAEGNPKVTPELCASVLAKYSRSNDGLDKILGKVDLSDPEKSIAAIFRFVDYGHASIGGLTGGIPIALDGVSVWLAFRIFELAAYCDGQESSTRYIQMSEDGLIPAGQLGFAGADAETVDVYGRVAVATYLEEYRRLDELAADHPEVVRYPANAQPKVRERIRKNFALDRARYFLPLTLRTNLAVIQTARAWTDVISGLASQPQPEAQEAARLITEALRPYAPNLIRHARAKAGWSRHTAEEIEEARLAVRFDHPNVPVHTTVECHNARGLRAALAHRENRYDRCGRHARLTPIQVTWDGMAIAEARDINRHRTGGRYFLATHKGFYLPSEVADGISIQSLARFTAAHRKALSVGVNSFAADSTIAGALLPYTLALGSQGTFIRTTTLDKFAYEAELRTGPGAHFRYAEHYRQAIDTLNGLLPPEDRDSIPVGQAEPE